MQAVGKKKAFEAVSQNVTITAVRNTSDDDFTDANAARSSGMPNGASSRGSANASGGNRYAIAHFRPRWHKRPSDGNHQSRRRARRARRTWQTQQSRKAREAGNASLRIRSPGARHHLAAAGDRFRNLRIRNGPSAVVASAQLVFSALFSGCADMERDLCGRTMVGRTSRVRILTLTLFRRKALPTMI